ncbi:MAG: DUF4291 domain-containing protein [Lachnospiraceae bacterium]|nr:DUF4291 domain-containing protein [Lachnospiraceae bacterium]
MKTEKKEIRAVYTNDTIRVYQAYNEAIAKEAVQKGTFGSRFKMERMTWIKPSFLWMMYRCGWGTKENQERVLAIDMKREFFDYIVNSAVVSSYNEATDMSREQWQEQVKNSDIRCQWDPEKDIWGNSLEYRSIQLGLRGKAVYSYVNEWIVHIEDITDYVTDLYERRNRGEDISQLLPKEQVYIVRHLRKCFA